MKIQQTPTYWQVNGKKLSGSQELAESVKEETQATCYRETWTPSQSGAKALKWGALGSGVGALSAYLGPWSPVAGAALGGALGAVVGAVLGRSRPEQVAVAGRLMPGPAGLQFAPHGQKSVALPVDDQLTARLAEEIAAPQSLDEIRQLPEFQWRVPSRADSLQALKDSVKNPLDVLVIGGGATGTGTALEAARRGLRVGGVEAYDFSSGTSSKSTKLIHGGVRYLEKAVKNFDRDQYDLVKEGLEERGTFLKMAPHLTDEVRLVTPCYKYWEVPYYYAGLWLYDRIAGQAALSATQVLSSKTTSEQLPEIKREGLKGSVVYSDGEFNDARMNVSLATTAAAHGAAMANYVEILSLIKEDGKVVGAQARDKRSGEEFPIRAKVVINATGPFLDGIRQMDDPQAPKLVVPSAGTHILVPKLKLQEGLLIPKAPNGSVAFFKPFEGGTLIGTTEEKTEITINPRTTQEQVEYLRELANGYLAPEQQIEPKDITSVWTGIRPLVKDPKKAGADTTELVRNHVVDVSPSGLVTIGGGKWTNFGRMAQDTMDAALASAGMEAIPVQRQGSRVIGAQGYTPELAGWLEKAGLPGQEASHLARNYGDRAVQILDLIGARPELGERLHPDHPYVAAEVVYAARHEMAQTPVDVLSRRTRMTFVDEKAALDALPRVASLMGGELGWTAEQCQSELTQSRQWLESSGQHGLK